MALKLHVSDVLATNLLFGVKARPPTRTDDAIRRQRLIDLLHYNINSRVQVISAPAGYGKTTLLVDFVNDLDIPVCWYSLDESDMDLGVFIEGLSTSVQSQFPDFSRQTETCLIPTLELTKDTTKLVNTFINELVARVSDYTIFVIEDYHFIEDSSTLKTTFNLLLNELPNNCHLIISSRSSLELPALSKLVVQRKANCLNISDLSFTPAEAKSLLATHYNTNLSDSEAEELVSETDGWIVAIVLKAQRTHDNFHMGGNLALLSKEDVFYFLVSEVYSKQPPEIRDFLLTSSTLDIIDPDICDRLLGTESSLSILRSIVRRQLFIQCIDSEKSCYRYHHLFHEFLQQKLLEEDPSRFRILHFEAAIQYENTRQHIEAVRHFMLAKKYDEVSRVINNVGEELLEAGRCATLLSWIDALPKDSYLTDQRIMMFHAQSLIHSGESNEAVRILNSLLDTIQGNDDWLFEARILSWRSAAYRLTGYFPEAENDIKASIRLLEKNKGPVIDTGDAYRRLGEILMKLGHSKQALNQLRRSLKCYTVVLNIDRIANVHNSLGVIYKHIGNLIEANMHFEKARTGWQKTKNNGALAMTLSNIAEIYQRQGEYEMALDTLQLGLKKARQVRYWRIEACILIAIAEVKRSLGLYDEAISACSQGLELARQVMETYYIALAKASMAETYRLLGDIDKAEMLIKEAISLATEHRHYYDVMQFRIQIGIIEYERGKYKTAIQTLSEVADHLEDMGDKHALAKVSLHLAQALFLARDYNQALSHLQELANLCNELGYYDFITLEGRNAAPLLQYGISKGIGGDSFRHTLEKIHSFRNETGGKFVNSTAKRFNAIKPDIGVCALGETKVSTYGLLSEAQWRCNRAKELFFYLLCSKTGRTSEQIATALWPELSPAKAIGNFHINLYRARRAIFPGVFTLKNGRYKICPEINIRFDVAEFENQLITALTPQCDNELRITSLERAIELYRGDFMEGFFNEWILEYRRELEDKYILALSFLAKIRSENGKYDSAIELMSRVIKIDQFNEEAYVNIIEWQMSKEDRISALTTYHRYLDRVVQELGTSPSPRIQILHRHILNKEEEAEDRT